MNPFKVGDVVHHVKYGEGVVTRTPSDQDLFTNVQFPKAGRQDCQPVYLSFTPWPKANHERPIQDGWWVVTHVGQASPMVGKKKGDIAVDVHGAYCGQADQYTFHKFLGDSWK